MKNSFFNIIFYRYTQGGVPPFAEALKAQKLGMNYSLGANSPLNASSNSPHTKQLQIPTTSNVLDSR